MAPSLVTRLAWRRDPETYKFTRRECLAQMAAVGLGLLLANGRGVRASGISTPRAVIIGAGFGGLACACELRAAGWDVRVIEARKRVGGRVLSFDDLLPGRFVEGGGELVGANHPLWQAYKTRFNLDLDPLGEDELAAPIVLDGAPLDRETADALWEEIDTALSKMNALAAPIDADAPWNSPNAQVLDRQTVEQWIAGCGMSSRCRSAVRAQLAGDNAVATAVQSLLGILTAIKGGGLENYWTMSETHRCRQGNQALAHRLAREVGDDRIRLGCSAVRVTWRDNRAAIECGNGDRLEADHVVLAVPPSVWNRITFDPPLPPTLAPQMGKAVKYLANVKRPFWREHGLSPASLTDGDITWTWEGGGTAADGSPSVLTAFSGGPAADRCLADEPANRDAAYRARLERAYPGFGEAFERSRFMAWPNDAWTRGAYSFPAPGQVMTMGPMLSRGLGPLSFVGEHCCYKFVGYMEGALQSGVATAHRLAAKATTTAPATAP